jgi:hypothetical protein
MPFPCTHKVEQISPLDHVRPATFVAGFLHQAESSVLPLDVVAGPRHVMPRQGNDELPEDVIIPQPLERLGEERLPQEAAILEEPCPAVACAAWGSGFEDLMQDHQCASGLTSRRRPK